MAVGARDQLDQLLVRKYAGLKVDNPIIEASVVTPDKMQELMRDYAQAQFQAMKIQEKLRETCLKTTSMAIQYRKSKNFGTGRA